MNIMHQYPDTYHPFLVGGSGDLQLTVAQLLTVSSEIQRYMCTNPIAGPQPSNSANGPGVVDSGCCTARGTLFLRHLVP